MFYGSIVALVTPFKANAIDFVALERLINFHVESGSNAIVVAGSTGEGSLLSFDEKIKLFKSAVNIAKHRIPIIAATSAISTQTCIELTKAAMRAGVDAVLISTPAYVRPPQHALIDYFKAVAQSVPIPIILYNVPSRTGCDLLPDSVAKLTKISNIIAIKEAVADLGRLAQLIALTNNALDIFSGDDPSACDFMQHGARGVISVSANVIPKSIVSMTKAMLAKDFTKGAEISQNLAIFHDKLQCESNPIPIKWLLAQQNIISNEIRKPLTQLSEIYKQPLLQALKEIEN